MNLKGQFKIRLTLCFRVYYWRSCKNTLFCVCMSINYIYM